MIVPTKDNEKEIKKEIENIDDIEYINDEQNKTNKIEKDNEINNNDKNEKLIYDYKTKEENKIFKNLNILVNLK